MSRMLTIRPCRLQNATERGISVSFIQNPNDTGLSHTNAMPESQLICLRCISPVKRALVVSAISTCMVTGPKAVLKVTAPLGSPWRCEQAERGAAASSTTAGRAAIRTRKEAGVTDTHDAGKPAAGAASGII